MLLAQRRVSQFERGRLLGSSLRYKSFNETWPDAVDRFCAARAVPLPLQQEKVRNNNIK